jgi:Zn-finger nucleic acid-binding protein
MRFFGSDKTGSTPARPPTGGAVCLQCGTPAAGPSIAFCRRCGLTIGAAPRANVELPTCPICYATVGDDGRLASLRQRTVRIDLVAHMDEHDQFPVGDDDYLETQRVGDLIRIGRWQAPFDVVRRYLVTGAMDGGRRREYQHTAIVTAMSQLKRWGPDAEIFGDQAEWQAARQAVTALMERYQRGARLPA